MSERVTTEAMRTHVVAELEPAEAFKRFVTTVLSHHQSLGRFVYSAAKIAPDMVTEPAIAARAEVGLGLQAEASGSAQFILAARHLLLGAAAPTLTAPAALGDWPGAYLHPTAQGARPTPRRGGHIAHPL